MDAAGRILGPPADRTILTCPSHQEPTLTRDEFPLYPPEERPYALSYTMNGVWRLSNRGGSRGTYRRGRRRLGNGQLILMCLQGKCCAFISAWHFSIILLFNALANE